MGKMSSAPYPDNKITRALPRPAKGAKPAPQYPKVGAGMAPNWKKPNAASGKGVNRRA